MSLYDLELEDWQELLDGQPKFRALQIWKAIHELGLKPEQLTSLPQQLRTNLSNNEELDLGLKLVQLSSDDNHLTEKALFSLKDGEIIESVLMHYPDRSTVCISSQAGCAMNCGFCATGQQGFSRHLSVGEIVEQIVWAINRTKLTRGGGVCQTSSSWGWESHWQIRNGCFLL